MKTIDAVIVEIEKAAERGYTMDEQYLRRVEEFFFWPALGVTHCQLVAQAIQNLDS